MSASEQSDESGAYPSICRPPGPSIPKLDSRPGIRHQPSNPANHRPTAAGQSARSQPRQRTLRSVGGAHDLCGLETPEGGGHRRSHLKSSGWRDAGATCAGTRPYEGQDIVVLTVLPLQGEQGAGRGAHRRRRGGHCAAGGGGPRSSSSDSARVWAPWSSPRRVPWIVGMPRGGRLLGRCRLRSRTGRDGRGCPVSPRRLMRFGPTPLRGAGHRRSHSPPPSGGGACGAGGGGPASLKSSGWKDTAATCAGMRPLRGAGHRRSHSPPPSGEVPAEQAEGALTARAATPRTPRRSPPAPTCGRPGRCVRSECRSTG